MTQSMKASDPHVANNGKRICGVLDAGRCHRCEMCHRLMRFANLLKLELQTLIEENGNLKIANAELRMDLDDADDATAMYIRRINGN